MQNEISITNDIGRQYFVCGILLLGTDMRKVSDAEYEVQGADHYIAGVSDSLGVA